jgi:hypothetical protein
MSTNSVQKLTGMQINVTKVENSSHIKTCNAELLLQQPLEPLQPSSLLFI